MPASTSAKSPHSDGMLASNSAGISLRQSLCLVLLVGLHQFVKKVLHNEIRRLGRAPHGHQPLAVPKPGAIGLIAAIAMRIREVVVSPDCPPRNIGAPRRSVNLLELCGEELRLMRVTIVFPPGIFPAELRIEQIPACNRFR